MGSKRRTIGRNTKEFKRILELAVDCNYISDSNDYVPVLVMISVIVNVLSEDSETKLVEIQPHTYEVRLDRNKYYSFKSGITKNNTGCIGRHTIDNSQLKDFVQETIDITKRGMFRNDISDKVTEEVKRLVEALSDEDKKYHNRGVLYGIAIRNVAEGYMEVGKERNKEQYARISKL